MTNTLVPKGGFIRQAGVWVPAYRDQVVGGAVYPRHLGDFANTASSVWGSAVTADSGAAHAKGTWTTLVASTSGDVNFLQLMVSSFVTATNTSTLLDIAVGGVGAEVVQVANLQVGYRTLAHLEVPIWAPSGSRISVRTQNAAGTDNTAITPYLFYIPRLGQPTLTAMGADTANSRGVVLTAPGALNTKGAWTQITASTAAAFYGLMVSFGMASSAAIGATAGLLIDVGIGGSGAEAVLIPDMHLEEQTNESYNSGYIPMPQVFGVDVPAGSRLSMRYQRSNAAGVVDGILHGIAA